MGRKLLLVKITQSCQTLCNPMDCSPPGSSVYGIPQARIQERVIVPFSRGSSWPRDWIQVSHIAGGFFTSEPPELLLRWSQSLPAEPVQPLSLFQATQVLLEMTDFWIFRRGLSLTRASLALGCLPSLEMNEDPETSRPQVFWLPLTSNPETLVRSLFANWGCLKMARAYLHPSTCGISGPWGQNSWFWASLNTLEGLLREMTGRSQRMQGKEQWGQILKTQGLCLVHLSWLRLSRSTWDSLWALKSFSGLPWWLSGKESAC